MAARPHYVCVAHILSMKGMAALESDDRLFGVEESKVNYSILRSLFKDVAFQIIEDIDYKLLLAQASTELEELVEKYDTFFESK